jgi:hypothetical protein
MNREVRDRKDGAGDEYFLAIAHWPARLRARPERAGPRVWARCLASAAHQRCRFRLRRVCRAKRLHDAFKASLEDPTVLTLLDRYDTPVIYMNSADYTRYATETYAAEKATIERVGLGKHG